MKKFQASLLGILCAELLVSSFPSNMNLSIQQYLFELMRYLFPDISSNHQEWLGNILGGIIFLVPLMALLISLSQDKAFSESKRTTARIAAIVIVMIALGGTVMTFPI